MKNFKTIYFPMTCEIVTKGHVMCIQYLKNRCEFLIIGLLTDEALKGYKKCVVPFEDRKYILEEMYNVSEVVPQNSLSPEDNIRAYEPNAIASGDGWEDVEMEVIKKYKLDEISIRLEGETKVKKYSSSLIKEKLKS